MKVSTLAPPESTEFKSLSGPIALDRAEGIVECFAAAIGNKDSVGDIILPGAFDQSLKKRKPRVVWGHDWNHPIGKVLEIYEVKPGDPRLPMKMKLAGVGGLYARVQFNLTSEKGREAFSNIAFFGEEGEWSIGYKTHVAEPDHARQANLLKVVELYEISPVLHGANQLTATISFKSDPANDVDFDDEAKAEIGVPQEAITSLTRGRGPRRGGLERLLRYWRPIMKRPGGFRRCLVILADHPELYPLPNICAWLHHETTGKWPNEGKRRLKKDAWYGDEKSWDPDAVGAIETSGADSDDDGDDLTDDDITHAFKVLGEFMASEKDFMDYLGNEENWEGDDDAAETGDGKGDCGCGCRGRKDGDDDLFVKAGRVLSSRNMTKVRQALALLTEVVDSAEVVRTKADQALIEAPIEQLFSLREFLDDVATYHGVDLEATEGGLVVKNYGVLSGEALDALDTALITTGTKSVPITTTFDAT